MKLLVLLKAFIFAATVHADSRPDLPGVLVVKVDGNYHPLSLPPKAIFEDFKNVLIWGNPAAPPVELTFEKNLLNPTYAHELYIGMNEIWQVIIGDKVDSRTITLDKERKWKDHKFMSCKSSLPNSGVYNYVIERDIQRLTICKDAEVYYLPFDNNTRNVFTNEGGHLSKIETDLTVSSDPPLALFIKLHNKWFPLTAEYSGEDRDSFPLVYNAGKQYPIDFKIDQVNPQLVSTNKIVSGWHACFEDMEASLGIQKIPCPEPITLDTEHRVVGKKVFVREDDSKLFSEDGEGRQAVDIYLYYYDRKTNEPLSPNPDLGFDHASGSGSAGQPVGSTGGQSGGSTGSGTGDKGEGQQGGQAQGSTGGQAQGGSANGLVVPTPDDNTKHSGSTQEHPKLPNVFFIKSGNTYIPLSAKKINETVSHFILDDSTNPPPAFEYVKGIASTKDMPTPGTVAFDNVRLVFGHTAYATEFSVDQTGKVNLQFYLCGEAKKPERVLFTIIASSPYEKCTKEDVYFLPYNKTDQTVLIGSQKLPLKVTNLNGQKTELQGHNTGEQDKTKENSGSGGEAAAQVSQKKQSQGESQGESQGPSQGQSGTEIQKAASKDTITTDEMNGPKKPVVETDKHLDQSPARLGPQSPENQNVESGSGLPKPKIEVPETQIIESGMEVGSSESDKNSSKKSNGESAVSNSTPEKVNNSNVLVPGSSKAKGKMEDTNEGDNSLDTLKKDTLKKDTLKKDTLNSNGALETMEGDSTTSGKAHATVKICNECESGSNPNATVCNECEHGSHTTVWKTYTDYTTYCPQATTVTITKCDKECVPSTMTVAAAATLTVTGKCIVPETTTVRHTAKEHSGAKGGSSNGETQDKKFKVKDSPSEKDGHHAPSQKDGHDSPSQKNGRKESLKLEDTFDQSEGPKPSEPKASKANQLNASELKAGSAKGGEKSGNSGKSGKLEDARTSQKTGTNSISKSTITPFVNAASKNAFGACILGFAVLLL